MTGNHTDSCYICCCMLHSLKLAAFYRTPRKPSDPCSAAHRRPAQCLPQCLKRLDQSDDGIHLIDHGRTNMLSIIPFMYTIMSDSGSFSHSEMSVAMIMRTQGRWTTGGLFWDTNGERFWYWDLLEENPNRVGTLLQHKFMIFHVTCSYLIYIYICFLPLRAQWLVSKKLFKNWNACLCRNSWPPGPAMSFLQLQYITARVDTKSTEKWLVVSNITKRGEQQRSMQSKQSSILPRYLQRSWGFISHRSWYLQSGIQFIHMDYSGTNHAMSYSTAGDSVLLNIKYSIIQQNMSKPPSFLLFPKMCCDHLLPSQQKQNAKVTQK